MGANPNEMYGDIPIRLEILSDARTMELRSEINYIQGANGKRQPVPFAGEMDLTGIDIIEHHVFSGENELFREWVILNPDVILTVMTDPGILKPILMEEFAKLRNENFRFTDFELHTFFGAVPEEGAKVPFLNDLRYRNHFASVIERYLESTPELDPVWKNWKNRNACLSRLKPATPKRNINFAP